MSKNLFFIGIILSACGLLSPPLALAAGLGLGLFSLHGYSGEAKRLSKFLLQASVVLLGFGMNFGEVLHVGKSGFIYTAFGIAFAMSIGMLLAFALGVESPRVPDIGGHSDMRGKRNSRFGACNQCRRRADGSVNGNSFRAEFDCAVYLPSDRAPPTSLPVPIRTLGCPRNSRHKFGSCGIGKVRSPGPDHRNHC